MSDFEFRDRLRRDYTSEPLKPTHPHNRQHTPQNTKPLKTRKHRSKKLLILLAILILIAAAGGGFYLHEKSLAPKIVRISPVPSNISKAVSFPVYYPDQSKLPAGYHLNTSSFNTPVKNGVSYSVSYDTNKKIVFSVQAKPSDTELQTFNSSYIPLRIDYQTPLGQSEIGSYNSHTLVSLPVVNGPWIVVTAPPDINQEQLKQVLQSLRK